MASPARAQKRRGEREATKAPVAKRNAKADKAPDAPPDPGAIAAAGDPSAQAAGVFVARVAGEQPGDYRMVVVPQGDVRITEVDTILQLGLREFRARLNLSA